MTTNDSATNTTVLDGLDFDAPTLCDVCECHYDKITARHAVMVLVIAMPCCTRRLPVCIEHRERLLRGVGLRAAAGCTRHRVVSCAHDVITFEPLP